MKFIILSLIVAIIPLAAHADSAAEELQQSYDSAQAPAQMSDFDDYGKTSNPQEICGTVGGGDGAVMLQMGERPVEILGSFQLLQNLKDLGGQSVCVDGRWKTDDSAFIASAIE